MRPDQTREHYLILAIDIGRVVREQQKRIISKQVFNQRLEKLGIATSKRSGGDVIQNFAQRWVLFVIHDFWPTDLPRIAEAEPFVRNLRLPSILDRLIEDPEFISDTVADSGDLE